MPKPWSAVADSEAYQALPPENREMVRQQYFSDVVATHVDPDHLESVRQQFDADTAPKAPTTESSPEVRPVTEDARAAVDRVTGTANVLPAPHPDEDARNAMARITGQASPSARSAFDTQLSSSEEQQFQEWKKKYAPHDSGADYDLRGAFKAGLTPDSTSGHWSDQFKKPNHPTFSDQSQYAKYGNPGHWEGDQFIPPASKEFATPSPDNGPSFRDRLSDFVSGLTGAPQDAQDQRERREQSQNSARAVVRQVYAEHGEKPPSDVEGQLASGLAQGASANLVAGGRAPEGPSENVAHGAGYAAGFIASPIARVAGAIAGRAVSPLLATKVTDTTTAVLAKGIAQDATQLSAMFTANEAGKALDAHDAAEAAQIMADAAKNGVKTGIQFGAIGRIIPGNDILQRAARIGALQATSEMMSSRNPTDWTPQTFADRAFDLGQNIVFGWLGIPIQRGPASVTRAQATPDINTVDLNAKRLSGNVASTDYTITPEGLKPVGPSTEAAAATDTAVAEHITAAPTLDAAISEASGAASGNDTGLNYEIGSRNGTPLREVRQNTSPDRSTESPELLSGLPRREYAEDKTEAQEPSPGSENESQRQVLRERLQASREIDARTMQGMRQESTNAPSRLQSANSSGMAVPGMPPELTQGRGGVTPVDLRSWLNDERLIPLSQRQSIEPEIPNASPIRTDQGELPETRQNFAGGEETRGNDIQRPPEAWDASSNAQGTEGTYRPPSEVERRTDLIQRRRVAEMSPEELRTALLTDSLTNLPNRRAYDESERLPVQARVDLDGFKAINDNYGHPSGDEILKVVAQHLDANKANGRVFRIGGDEFPGEFHTEVDARTAMEATRQSLAKHQFTFELPDGSQKTFTGVRFSYGLGPTESTAEHALRADKLKRAAEGLRSSQRAPAEANAESTKGQQAPTAEVVDHGKDTSTSGVVSGERSKPSGLQEGATAEERTTAEAVGQPRNGQKLEVTQASPISVGRPANEKTGALPVTKTPLKSGVSVPARKKGPITQASILADITAAGPDGMTPPNATWRLVAKKLVREGKAVEISGKFATKERKQHATISVKSIKELSAGDKNVRFNLTAGAISDFDELVLSDRRIADFLKSKHPELWDMAEQLRKALPPRDADSYSSAVARIAEKLNDEEIDTLRKVSVFAAEAADEADIAAYERKARPLLSRPREVQKLIGPEELSRRTQEAGDRERKATEATEAPAAKIKNVGETLWYNKSERLKRGLKWDEVKDLNDALKVREVVKTKVWPKPNYEQLVQDGMEPMIAHLMKQVYDGIAPSPSVHGTATDEQLKLYIDTVAQVRDAMIEFANNKDLIRASVDGVLPGMRAATGASSARITDLTGHRGVLDLAFPGDDQLKFRGDGKWAQAIQIIGGRKPHGIMQLGRQEFMDAAKAVSKGFPKPQEQFERQGYKVAPKSKLRIAEGWRTNRETNEREPLWTVMFDQYGRSVGASFTSQEEAQAEIDKLKPFLLLDKHKSVIGDFATEAEAMDAARAKTKREGGGQIEDRGVALAEAERQGPMHRLKGENVTAEMLMMRMGFRGVNFGNWANQAERQASLNAAYDSFMDLADIMGVPPEALSLNGMLGIAFGAQGGGKYAAHFVPGVNEINLTKTKGAGALAHEWGHALDHYFATQADLAKNKDPFLTHSVGTSDAEGYTKRAGQKVKAFGDGIRPEVVARFKQIMQSISKRPATEADVVAKREAQQKKDLARLNSWLSFFRRGIEQGATEKDVALKAFDGHAERLRSGDMGDGLIGVGKMQLPEVIGKIRLLVQHMAPNSGMDTPKNWEGLEAVSRPIRFAKTNKDVSAAHVPQQMVDTDYLKGARALNKGDSTYWTTPTELWARAFETYVLDKLEAQARKNQYLSSPIANESAYPQGEERTTINAGFDALIGALETKEENGKTVLYSTGADFSYRHLADQAKIIARIQALAKQMNPDANIAYVPQLFGAGQAVLRSGGKTAERQSVAGSYDPAQRLITLALNYSDPETTFRHETIHDLRELGLFKPTEWKLLERQAEQKWKNEYGVPDNEEAIASAFGDYRSGKKFDGFVQSVFNKIRAFFVRIKNLFRGMGFNTVDDVFQRVERGEVAGRDAKPLGRKDIVHSTVPFYPKGAVIKVTAYSKAPNLNGSGDAYLDDRGRMVLDGHAYSIGESAWLDPETNRYLPEPSPKLIDRIKKSSTDYINGLVDLSSKIDRTTKVFPDVDNSLEALFKPSGKDVRYRNIEHNQWLDARRIDELSPTHDPEAIEKYVIDKDLDRYRFEVGGILHVDEENPLTQKQKDAIQKYAEAGGRLGRTAIDALNQDGTNPDIRYSVGKKSINNAVAKLRDPSLEKTGRELSRGGLRSAFANYDRYTGSVDTSLKKLRRIVSEIPVSKRWEAMHEYQTGGVSAVKDESLRPIFQWWKDSVDKRVETIQSWDDGFLDETIPNYFSQMWQKPDKAEEWYRRMLSKGPLEGRKSFLKKRTYANYKEGMSWKVFSEDGDVRYFDSETAAKNAAGPEDKVRPPLEPISSNFIDIAQASLQQMDKFITMHEFRRWLDDKGFIKTVKRGDPMPVGYAKVDDPSFRSRRTFVYEDKKTGEQKAGLVEYEYAAPELIAKDINNYLSPGLYKYGAWRNFRYAQNLLLTARLGFSAFHAGFTTVDTLVSHLDVGGRYLLQGDIERALKNLGEASISPILSPLKGRTFLKQFYGEQASDPHTAAILDFLTQGGARGRMNPTDFNNSWASMKRAWDDKQLKQTALHVVPAVIEGAMRPIMHYLVPWQKMTAKVILAKLELDRVAKNLGLKRGDYAAIVKALHPDAMRQMAYKVVQQVDDRLGQVAYDNLFWNKIVKDISQATIQSVGWNVGTANVVLGGLSDVRRLTMPEKLLSPLDKEGKIKDADLGRVTGRLSYLITLNFAVAMAGALIMFGLTGEWPQELRDYFFFKTGRKNKNGTDERMSLPSYVKDEYALGTHLFETIGHKLHPSISMMVEAKNNEDFYGNMIVNPDDPWTKIAAQVGAYLGKSIEPYAFRNAQQNSKQGASLAGTLAPFVGVTPAPASVSRSPFEEYLWTATKLHSMRRTPEQSERAQEKRDAIDSIRAGKEDEIPDGLFNGKEKASLRKAANTDVQVSQFKRLSLQQKIVAWDKATPEERERFGLRRMIKQHDNRLDPDQQDHLNEILR